MWKPKTTREGRNTAPKAPKERRIVPYIKSFNIIPKTFVLLNCRSVQNKSGLIREAVLDKQTDFLVFTETWLRESDTFTANDLCPEGYSFIGCLGCVYRSKYNLVRSNFASKSVFSTFESLALKLLGPYNCHIIAIYRPPPSTKNKYTESVFHSEMDSLLGELALTPGNILLAGDFNLHWNKPEKPGVKHF